jgi:primase-polymerase (primpol)-like protein
MIAYPTALQSHPHWVCWRLEPRQDKPTKVPINPRTGANASTTDPATWGTFAAAIARMRRDGYPGVGFVFAVSDPFFGVDLDACIDAATGTLAPWAGDIINRLDTYTAFSQSGLGVHIVGRGTLPLGRRRKGHIEMYDTGRFFALTGQHVPWTPLTIEARQEALDALHRDLFPPAASPHHAPLAPSPPLVSITDAALLDKMFTAKNGAAVQRLWNGDVSGYTSASEADLALCSHLAFWCGGDTARIDALFRQSGLCRERKWQRQDYRARTISKALERGGFYDPTSPRRDFVDPWLGPRRSWCGVPVDYEIVGGAR